MERIGSRHLSITPRSSIFPTRASTGMCARCWPSGVRFSPLSRACRVVSDTTAASTAAGLGGVGIFDND